MLDNKLAEYLSHIKTPCQRAMEEAQLRLDSLVKPPGSLGRLEDIAIALSGISGKINNTYDKRCVIIMASDNGVVEEGISSAPQNITHLMTLNFSKGITGAAVLAKQFNSDLIVVDIGVNADIEAGQAQIKNKKIRKSTWNIARQAAMTREEALKAIIIGIDTAIEAVKDGYTLLGAGEMGIGNTTTSAAVLCALTGIPPEKAAGKGAGLDNKAYEKKISVVKTALNINKPNPDDPVEIIAKVGGFDIAAMTGLYIGAAYLKVPIVIDGFISIVAALAASRLNPIIKNYMFASHASYEQGFDHAAKALGIQPYLYMNMRLGEGSGCPLMFAMIDAACAVINNMGTFKQASISEEYLNKINDSSNFTINLLYNK